MHFTRNVNSWAQMTRVTHRVTQLHHQHTKQGGGREIWLHSSPQLIIHLPQIHPPHSPHPTTIGWREEMCVCHLLLRTIKQNLIGVLWGKQSSPTIPACKHAKTPDTNRAMGLIYCRPLIKCVWWVHFSTKLLCNPPLLQRGAPKTNLGKDTTPHTPPSVPLLCETPHMVERTPNDVRDTHTLYAQREAFTYVHNGI